MSDWTAERLRQRLKAMLSTGEMDLPLPGAGATAQRHRALYEFGRLDLSIARLAEAHTDAVAILKEAGREPRRGLLYGVWASDGPSGQLKGVAAAGGGLTLDGAKDFCSGMGIVDAALVSVHVGAALLLVELPLTSRGLKIEASRWASPAFRATCTGRISFRRVRVGADCLLGGRNWYLDRVGFWHGAIGPAACWAGGAAGLVDAAQRKASSNPHTRAQLGALLAAEWGLRACLDQSAHEIDRSSSNYEQARQRAMMVRHLVERACTEVLDRFGRATGPQLLAFDAAIAQRHAELALYIRQCHAERDMAAILTD
jgi:alkylation response protein AidB-like acyl-CoA dehydrogenase